MNATQILKAAGVDKYRRAQILREAHIHEKIQEDIKSFKVRKIMTASTRAACLSKPETPADLNRP